MKYVLIILVVLLCAAILFYLGLLLPAISMKKAGNSPHDVPPLYSTNTSVAADTTTQAGSGFFEYSKKPVAFSFRYPLFEKWTAEVQELEIRYIPDSSNGRKFEYPPTIQMQLVAVSQNEPFMADGEITGNGVRYKDMAQNAPNGVYQIFFDVNAPGGQLLDIRIPKMEESGTSFSGQDIYDLMIATFQVTSGIEN